MNQPMYREVKTKQDMQKFDHEWTKICEEKGATFYPYHPNSVRYFIVDEDYNDVGTIEFTKRAPETFSVCEDFFDFSNHPKVSKNTNEILEVGKICIFKHARGAQHVDKLLYLMFQYAKKHGIKQYLGYMTKDFLRVLLLCYGIKMERLGKEIVQSKHIGIPVMCDIEQQTRRLMTKGSRIPTDLLHYNQKRTD